MKVLVPVDYSDHSRAVLAFALGLTGADVTVVHVYETQPEVPLHYEITMPDGKRRNFQEVIREGAMESMREFLRNVKDGAGLPCKVLSGAPVAAILEFAEQGHFDWIVVGTHGRTGFGRFALGSVAERLVRTSPIPTLVVPRAAAHAP